MNYQSNNFPPTNKRLTSSFRALRCGCVDRCHCSRITILMRCLIGPRVISPDTVRGPRSSTVQAISFNSLWTCKLQPDSDLVPTLERRLGPEYAIRKPSQRLSAQLFLVTWMR